MIGLPSNVDVDLCEFPGAGLPAGAHHASKRFQSKYWLNLFLSLSSSVYVALLNSGEGGLLFGSPRRQYRRREQMRLPKTTSCCRWQRWSRPLRVQCCRLSGSSSQRVFGRFWQAMSRLQSRQGYRFALVVITQHRTSGFWLTSLASHLSLSCIYQVCANNTLPAYAWLLWPNSTSWRARRGALVSCSATISFSYTS